MSDCGEAGLVPNRGGDGSLSAVLRDRLGVDRGNQAPGEEDYGSEHAVRMRNVFRRHRGMALEESVPSGSPPMSDCGDAAVVSAVVSAAVGDANEANQPCGDAWSANAERLPRRFGIAVPDAGYVPNRVTDLENANALLKLDVIRLRAELAECRAAMHEAGLTFMDKDPQPLGKPSFPATALRHGWAK